MLTLLSDHIKSYPIYEIISNDILFMRTVNDDSQVMRVGKGKSGRLSRRVKEVEVEGMEVVEELVLRAQRRALS